MTVKFCPLCRGVELVRHCPERVSPQCNWLLCRRCAGFGYANNPGRWVPPPQ